MGSWAVQHGGCRETNLLLITTDADAEHAYTCVLHNTTSTCCTKAYRGFLATVCLRWVTDQCISVWSSSSAGCCQYKTDAKWFPTLLQAETCGAVTFDTKVGILFSPLQFIFTLLLWERKQPRSWRYSLFHKRNIFLYVAKIKHSVPYICKDNSF